MLGCDQLPSVNIDKHKNDLDSLTFMNYDHSLWSEYYFYHFTKDSLTITSKPAFYIIDKKDPPGTKPPPYVHLKKEIKDNTIREAQKLQLDTLEDSYHNFCVWSTGAAWFSVETECDSISKKTSLHHYYLKQIELLIDILNREIPDSLKISYLPSDTKQDCKYSPSPE